MRSIHCEASSPLDFDRIISAIADRYPATRVVEEDWYAERYAADLAASKKLGLLGTNYVIESALRVWVEKGLQRGFEVPIRDDLRLYARLDKTGGYFFCRESDFDASEVKPLIELLRQYDLILRIEGQAGG